MLVKFIYQIYFNDTDMYGVCKYKDIENNKQIICTGINLPTFKNVTYDVKAEECQSPKYGTSYKINSWKECVNKTENDIVEYLSCGLFKGITEKRAKKIYEAFGNECLDVLEHDINRLFTIKGIGRKTLTTIKESYTKNTCCREIAKILTPFGIPAGIINKIFVQFKEDSLDIINNSPYKLCEINGLTFPVVDKIALERGIPETDYERIKSASDHILKRNMDTGNVCMEKIEYALELIRILNTSDINKKNIVSFVLKMIRDDSVKYNKRVMPDGKKEEYFYYPPAYEAERLVAEKINALLIKKPTKIKNIDELINKFSGDIELDETQKEAIRVGVTQPLFIITGGPGTGKTTILKIIAQINEYINNNKNNNIFLSPTGRAATRITESTGYPAQTIHSALRIFSIDDEYLLSSISGGNISDSHIFIDESSMIDLWIMRKLLLNINNCTIGFIGDADQLPSVKCGSVLRDLIKCNIIPCVQLDHIHRQSADALNICNNAANIKKGIEKLETGEDFEIIEASNLESAEEKIIKTALKTIEKYGESEVKVLCPFKKGYCGVYRINNILQEKLNPLTGTKEISVGNGMKIHLGDPVMQLKNRKEVSNGDTGFVLYVNDKEIDVVYSTSSTTTVTYTYKEAAEQLTLAYAFTVHKSQGSEYDAIIMPLLNDHGLMKRRNILYTGITRGKHKISLIGAYSAFYDAIRNNMIEDRHSMLSTLINPNNSNLDINTSTTVESIKPKKEETKYEQLSLPLTQ